MGSGDKGSDIRVTRDWFTNLGSDSSGYHCAGYTRKVEAMTTPLDTLMCLGCTGIVVAPVWLFVWCICKDSANRERNAIRMLHEKGKDDG